MATPLTYNVSGVPFLRILLTDATSTTVTFTGAVDGQKLTVTYQQTSTGSLLGGNVNNIGQAPASSGSDLTQTYVYDSSTNSWNTVPTTPTIVAGVSASLGFAVFNAAAAVALVPTGGPAGTYRFTLYGVTTTTFVTNTEETITLGFTDDDEAETVVWTTAALTAGTKLPPVSSTVSNSVTFRSTGSAAITYTPNVTGSAATAGAMAVSIVLERLF